MSEADHWWALYLEVRRDMMGDVGIAVAIPKLEQALAGLARLNDPRGFNIMVDLVLILRVAGQDDDAVRTAHTIVEIGRINRAQSIELRGVTLLKMLTIESNREEGTLRAFDATEQITSKKGDDIAAFKALSTRFDELFRLEQLEQELANYKEQERVVTEARGDLGCANVILMQGRTLLKLKCHEEALRSFYRAEQLATVMGDTLDLANAVKSIGDALLRLGRNDEALTVFTRAEQLYFDIGSPLGCANVATCRGDIFFNRGDNLEALEAFKQAELLAFLANDDHVYVLALRKRGDVLSFLGRHQEALRVLELVEQLSSKTNNEFERAMSILMHGRIMLFQGNLEEALDNFLQAEQVFLAERSAEGLAYVELSRAEVLYHLGHNDEALLVLNQAENQFSTEGDYWGGSNAAQCRGEVLFRLGRHGEALSAFVMAEELSAKLGSLSLRANATNSLGRVLSIMRHHEAALRAFERAEQFSHQCAYEVGRVNAIQGQGVVLLLLGRNKEALCAFEQSEHFAAIGDYDLGRANAVRYRGQVLFAVALVEKRDDLFLEAEALIKRALALHRAHGAFLDVVGAREIHASALLRVEQHRRAIEVCIEGLADVEHLRQLDTSPLARATVGEGATGLLRTLLSAHLALRDARSAVAAFEQRRNWTLDAQRTHRIQRPEAVSTADWSEFIRLRDRITREADAHIATPESLRASRAEHACFAALFEQITPLLPSATAATRDPLAPLIAARAATVGWALLAFQSTSHDGHLCCLFASPKHGPVHVTLTATRDDLVAPLNAILGWQATHSLHDRPVEQWRRVLGQLGTAILESEFTSVLSLDAADATPEAKTLRALLTECRGAELRILPTELLQLVPWSALPWGDGYLVEHHAVVMASSIESAFTPPAPLSSRRALVVGNPTGDLPFAGWEARVVSLLLRNDDFEVSEYRADAPPTADTILAEGPHHAVVHLSTHAEMDLSQPANSGIRFGSNTVARLPALLDLHLRGCTVILSACQTGLSDPNRALDTVSLSAALLAAGAARALGTLWTVHDASTALLVVDVYRRALAGTPWPVALQEAQLAMLRGTLSLASLPHDAPAPPEVGSRQKPTRVMSQTPLGGFASPYHWGAFQLYGR